MQVKRDPLKGLILEQKTIRRLNVDDMAVFTGVSRSTYCRFMGKHTSLWLTEAVHLCIALGLSEDEIKKSITFERGKKK